LGNFRGIENGIGGFKGWGGAPILESAARWR